jgi:hypothetical protein
MTRTDSNRHITTSQWQQEVQLACVQRETSELRQYLSTLEQELEAANAAEQALVVDVASQKLRVIALEKDEQVVQKAEIEALGEKIIAQKRLVEMGGHEIAIQALQKTLAEAKQEHLETRSKLWVPFFVCFYEEKTKNSTTGHQKIKSYKR